MEVISDISVLGKATFRSSSEFHEDASFWNSSNTGVALRSPEGVAGYLGLVYDNEPLPRTAFWEGDLEIGALGKTAVDAEKGFLRVGTCDGEPVGTPRSVGSGTPVVFDSVSKSLYAYSGGGWEQMGGGTKSVGYSQHWIPKWDFYGNLVRGSILETGFGELFVDASIVPGHARPTPVETIGKLNNKWDAVYAKEVYTDLISAPLLATNEHGKIVLSDVTPGGGSTGNVSTDGGTQYRLASWLTANKLGDSPLAVDANDVISHGSMFPATGATVGLGSSSSPWASLYATSVYVLSDKSESILKTGSDGRIQGGSLPVATTATLGGIIVGQNLSVSGSGVLNARLPSHFISSHSDVQYPSPLADNQMLGWNGATSRWENRVVPSVAHTLSSHTDVNIAGPVTVGHVLTYVGGAERWKNAPIPAYILPVAKSGVLGGVMPGTNVTIDGDGRISATVPAPPAAPPAVFLNAYKKYRYNSAALSLGNGMGDGLGDLNGKWPEMTVESFEGSITLSASSGFTDALKLPAGAYVVDFTAYLLSVGNPSTGHEDEIKFSFTAPGIDESRVLTVHSGDKSAVVACPVRFALKVSSATDLQMGYSFEHHAGDGYPYVTTLILSVHSI
jgi:hypothetical protein